jgi:Xaa-Pro aminopeptidase
MKDSYISVHSKIFDSDLEISIMVSKISITVVEILINSVTHRFVLTKIFYLFIYLFFHSGALQQSYLPIVGAGDDGAILHYIANNNPIVDGELLLIDAGSEYWGYP